MPEGEQTQVSQEGRAAGGDAVCRESGFREWQGLMKRDRGWAFWNQREPPTGLHPGVMDHRGVFSQTHGSQSATKRVQEQPGAFHSLTRQPKSYQPPRALSLATRADFPPPSALADTWHSVLFPRQAPKLLDKLGWTGFHTFPTSPTQVRNFGKHGD